MKKGLHFVFLVLLFVPLSLINAQIKVDLKEKIVKEADRRANKKTNEAIDKVFDKAEEGITAPFRKKNKNQEEDRKNKKGQTAGEISYSHNEPANQNSASQTSDIEKPSLLWVKYDFVPGDKVFFEDNQENEQNGEFPSRWDLYRGSGVENCFR